MFRVKLSISLHNQLGRESPKVFLFSGGRDELWFSLPALLERRGMAVQDGPRLLPSAHEPLL